MSGHTPAEEAFAFAMGERHAELMKELDAMRKQRDELLEALKAMRNAFGMHGPCRNHDCQGCAAAYAKARTAIAKAKREGA